MDYDYIKQGDCLELMKDIPDESIDLVLTSPPYDNLRSYNGALNWNFDIYKNIAKELYRVLKKGGVIVWIVNDATIKGSESGTSFKQALYFKEIGFNIHDTMIWKKPELAFPEINRYYPSFEYMFILSKGKPNHYHLIADKPNKTAGKNVYGSDRLRDGSVKAQSGNGKRKVKEFSIRQNVWEMSSVKSNIERTGHPAQFPLALAKDHILSWSNENDIILDPFLGSGTTAVACKETNRHFIGFELCKEYFEIANKRLDLAKNGTVKS